MLLNGQYKTWLLGSWLNGLFLCSFGSIAYVRKIDGFWLPGISPALAFLCFDIQRELRNLYLDELLGRSLTRQESICEPDSLWCDAFHPLMIWLGMKYSYKPSALRPWCCLAAH
jgi:hypothetical protein